MSVEELLRDDPISEQEVHRRLPTLELIGDDDLYYLTVEAARHAPEYFWRAPASFNHHREENRWRHGLWAHTLLVSTGIEVIAPSFEGLGYIEEGDTDYAHAAAILHDMQKWGRDRREPKASSDHDLLMAAVADWCDLPEDVKAPIASHMGPWNDGPEPDVGVQLLVHLGDMMASTPFNKPAVHGPIPEEIAEMGYEEVDLIDG